MNCWQLSDDFLQQFKNDSAFSSLGNNFFHGQDDDNFTVPCLVFQVTDEPFSADALAGRFRLELNVHGASADGPTSQATLVAAVTSKLHGSGKSALLTAMNGLGRWLIPGWSSGAQDPATQGMRFLTPVICAGTAVQLTSTGNIMEDTSGNEMEDSSGNILTSQA